MPQMPSLYDFLKSLGCDFEVRDFGMGQGEVYTDPEHKEAIEEFIHKEMWAPFSCIKWLDIKNLVDREN